MINHYMFAHAPRTLETKKTLMEDAQQRQSDGEASQGAIVVTAAWIAAIATVVTLLAVLVPAFASGAKAAGSMSPPTQTFELTVGVTMVPSATYVSTGIEGTKTFSVSPALPSGLTMSASTGVITGTPTQTTLSATYTVLASDGSSSALATVTIVVIGPSLTGVSVVPSARVINGAVGTAISPTAALVTSTMTGLRTFSVNPPLPTGLVIDATSGVISGTPTAASLQKTHIVTVANGSTFGLSLLTVNISGTFALSPAQQTISGKLGTAIAATVALVAPELTGVKVFTISPALPAGLQVNAQTGVISGTATVTQASVVFTIRANDGSRIATSTVRLEILSATVSAASCLNPSIGGRLVASIDATANDLGSGAIACASRVGVRARGITVAISSTGIANNSAVSNYAVVAQRINGGAITKTVVVAQTPSVTRTQFGNLKRGAWTITITAYGSSGAVVGSWTTTAFSIG